MPNPRTSGQQVPVHSDDPCLERPAIVLCHGAEAGSRLRHRRSSWRGARESCLRRMHWAVVGRHREQWPLLSLRACSALWKPAARLPIVRNRFAPHRRWSCRGSLRLRRYLFDMPRMQGWLAGRTQRQLWKIPWLRPLSDLRREGENSEPCRVRSHAAATPKDGLT